MLHQVLRVVAAVTCLAGAALIHASTSGPHMVLFKSRNPPTFPGIPDVSVWLGLQRAEAIVDTRIGAPSVQPFGYDQTLICHELCQQLHDGGMKAVQVLYFSSAALVVAATLSAVGLASLPEHIKLPEAARAVRRRCSSASMASTASGTAVLLALCGMLSWFLMLRSLQQGADGNSAASASNSHGIHIDEDEEMHLGESAWLIVAGLGCSVVAPVILSVSAAYERLNYLEGELYYQHL